MLLGVSFGGSLSIFSLAAIFELRVAYEFAVVCEKGFEVAYVAADAFRRYAVFRGKFFDGEVFPAQASKEYFKQPSLFRVVHQMRPRIYLMRTLYVTDGTGGRLGKGYKLEKRITTENFFFYIT